MGQPVPPCPQPPRWKDLLEGALSEPDQAALSQHLETCEQCQQTVESLAAGKESWDNLARHLGVGADAGEGPEKEPGATGVFSELAAARDESLAFLGPPAKPGQRGCLGHYEVLEVIGRGGMGVVLKALDQKLQRIVALKVMAPQLATSATARNRFIREGRAAAAIRNDHVISIHAVEEEKGLPYLVMEYIAGPSLQERLDRRGPPELTEILRIGMQMARGLAAAHAQGLIHRDIKPANILLENGVERVKITDFGLARAADDAHLTQSGVVAGTPQYMSPEQARGDPVDARTDLFSLGSILYALCTGRPPFRASSALAVLKRVCDETPRPIGEINVEIPAWLTEVIGRLHAKDPAARFQSAAEVAELLGEHLARLQQPAPSPPPAVVAPRLDSRRRPWLTLAAAILLALGGVGYFFGPAVYRFSTNQGQLVIETDDPDVEVTVRGEKVSIVDTRTGKQVNLKAGQYHLELTKGKDGLRLSTKSLSGM